MLQNIENEVEKLRREAEVSTSIMTNSMSLLGAQDREQIEQKIIELARRNEGLQEQVAVREEAWKIIDWLLDSTKSANLEELWSRLRSLASRLASTEEMNTVRIITMNKV